MANVHIDAIEGTSWLDVGQNSIISYKLNNDNGFGAWTATEAAAFAAAAQKWADVADITFVDFTGLAFDSDWIENKVDTATMISITGKDFGGVHQYPKAS
ncbi:MAG: hypothetical protein KDJ77_04825, partial [Rhodobiaceae bacterium]|nr:hypothetical protein [Rhodobiaceae bacterium]